jgi:hypothetical protein
VRGQDAEVGRGSRGRARWVIRRPQQRGQKPRPLQESAVTRIAPEAHS